MNRVKTLAAGLIVLAASATGAAAVPYHWADWTTADAASAAGTIAGIGIAFTGNLNPVAQVSGGTNFWASSPSTYTYNVGQPDGVDNGPGVASVNGPANSDIIRLTGGPGTGVQTLTFEAPILNPVMAILSLGNGSAVITYDFDAEFEILNYGPGYWGNGPLQHVAGDILTGNEGHGIIRFIGVYSSISWTVPTYEFWHGFQIGVAGLAPPQAPEPGTAALLGLALLGLGLRRRLRRP